MSVGSRDSARRASWGARLPSTAEKNSGLSELGRENSVELTQIRTSVERELEWDRRGRCAGGPREYLVGRPLCDVVVALSVANALRAGRERMGNLILPFFP